MLKNLKKMSCYDISAIIRVATLVSCVILKKILSYHGKYKDRV